MQVALLHQTMIALRARRRAVRLARSILYPPIHPSENVDDIVETADTQLPRLYPVVNTAALLRRGVLALLGVLLVGACILAVALAGELLQ